jgi:hypothetical protein
MLPKKKFPVSARERDMGFLEKTGQPCKQFSTTAANKHSNITQKRSIGTAEWF